MKLKTKLTALCAVLLFAVAVSLTAAMLWLVREQSYQSLAQNSKRTMDTLTSSFFNSASRNVLKDLPPVSRRAYLTYCFRSCGVSGSVLVADGQCLSASTTIDPTLYLSLPASGELWTVRVHANGRHYLVQGRTMDLAGYVCQVYLVTDASGIYTQLWQLSGWFALLALCIGLLGLAGGSWIIGRTLRPLSDLSRAADHIASGNYSQRVQIAAQDEVGMLAQNFNRMAMAVQTHVDTLQEQNQRQKLFIGAVTHELKTPLTSLLLNVNTLQTVYLSEEKQGALLESMDTQLHWLETMVRKLLTLLSMEKNVKCADLRVPEFMEQVRLLTEGVCKKYGVSLQLTCAAEHLLADGDLMCSALVNLIENGAKASPPGGVIRVLAEETGFTVTDYGCGIPEKELQRVTDPFYMADPSRSKAKGGFGLGLALVREIAAVHGGRLELESTLGKGTTARILLPQR